MSMSVSYKLLNNWNAANCFFITPYYIFICASKCSSELSFKCALEV